LEELAILKLALYKPLGFGANKGFYLDQGSQFSRQKLEV